jgi:hypothetical protein
VIGALVDAYGASQSNDGGLVQRSKVRLPKDLIALSGRAGFGANRSGRSWGCTRTSRVGNGKRRDCVAGQVLY